MMIRQRTQKIATGKSLVHVFIHALVCEGFNVWRSWVNLKNDISFKNNNSQKGQGCETLHRNFILRITGNVTMKLSWFSLGLFFKLIQIESRIEANGTIVKYGFFIFWFSSNMF